jgi:molecular chaperone DnaJ
MAKKDHYSTLGVTKSASKEEIKKAFYKLAGKHHPDKGGDEAKFKEVNEAYQILSDDKKRKEYDMYGESFSHSNPGANHGAGFGGFGGFDPSQFGGDMQFDFGDLGDIFGDMFSGFGYEGGARSRRGRDMSLEIEIPFAESVFGTERKVLISKVSKCKTCNATGGKPGAGTKTCETCNGKGKIHETRKTFMGAFQTVKNCDVCEGVGSVPKESCSDCKGAGVKQVREEITINIPAGINNGEMIKMAGQGEAVKSAEAGDLFVKIRVQSDKNWHREGYDLVINHKIKLSDALLGKKENLFGIDGEISFEIPAGVSIGEAIRIVGRGVPNTNKRNRGDVIVRLIIELPKKLSKKAKTLVEELKEEGV